jgi:predicted house-cleaning noncanonical NTP pyrophosphatase (MazG superfamily)
VGKRLVRDDALKTWRVPGAEHQVRPVRDHAEHVELLRRKVIEESGEVAFANGRSELVKELADLFEVMLAVAKVSRVPWEEVVNLAAVRRCESGGFERGMVWENDR